MRGAQQPFWAVSVSSHVDRAAGGSGRKSPGFRRPWAPRPSHGLPSDLRHVRARSSKQTTLTGGLGDSCQGRVPTISYLLSVRLLQYKPREQPSSKVATWLSHQVRSCGFLAVNPGASQWPWTITDWQAIHSPGLLTGSWRSPGA